MGKRPERAKAESMTDLTLGMGRERRALRAKKATIVLLQVCASICLISAVASFAGYLPHAIEPALVLALASVAGFVLAAIEARKT